MQYFFSRGLKKCPGYNAKAIQNKKLTETRRRREMSNYES